MSGRALARACCLLDASAWGAVPAAWVQSSSSPGARASLGTTARLATLASGQDPDLQGPPQHAHGLVPCSNHAGLLGSHVWLLSASSILPRFTNQGPPEHGPPWASRGYASQPSMHGPPHQHPPQPSTAVGGVEWHPSQTSPQPALSQEQDTEQPPSSTGKPPHAPHAPHGPMSRALQGIIQQSHLTPHTQTWGLTPHSQPSALRLALPPRHSPHQGHASYYQPYDGPQRTFINPRQLYYEFLSPDRAMTSYLMATSMVASLATTLNPRLMGMLIQNNYLVGQGEWWRLLTAPFLHHGVLHLLGNMLAVHYLGPPVEQLLSRTAFMSVYMSGAVAGGLAHYYYSSAFSSVLGSSGAIAGLFSAWVVYKLRNRSFIGWTSHDTSFVVQMVVINALISFALSGTVAHTAHVGGLVGGALAMFLIGPRYVWQSGRTVDAPILPWFKNLP